MTGDSKLVVWGGNGRLSLVENATASPGAYTELARAVRVLPATSWPHVVLSGGRLFCKDRDGNLACFDLR
jgi:hypothetical protein